MERARLSGRTLSFDVRRYLPFADLRGYRASWLVPDLLTGSTLLFLAVPQGIAYAVIAGLPPAAGLYAAAFPVVAGSLLRSSRHVISAPTNAVSLLVGTATAAAAGRYGMSPTEVGLTLAFLVGVIQLSAGLLRLDVVVDYVSNPVLCGYITGAAVLIAVGQLPNVTGTSDVHGTLPTRLAHWISTLDEASLLAVGVAAATILLVVALRRLDRRFPAALLAMVAGIALVAIFRLGERGLEVAGDLSPTPAGLPPLTVPVLVAWIELLPVAVACTVLSLVEASSVARAIAARSGQRLDMSAEFTGQGAANLAAAFTGGYPVGGSLSRSMLNEQGGSRSRLSGAVSGALMLVVLFLFGPLVDRTPIAGLAGLLLVIAWDLVDREKIATILHGTGADVSAFLATLVGTWVLPLDKAIYLGVGISVVLFLRRARLLTLRELAISERGRFREVSPEWADHGRPCTAIRIMNLTGPLFFAVAGELENKLDPFVRDPDVRVLILRLRQADRLDVTAASVLESVAKRMRGEGRALFLLGVRPDMTHFLERTGILDTLGTENVFSVKDEWFSAMRSALRRALDMTGEHACGDRCPLREYLSREEREV